MVGSSSDRFRQLAHCAGTIAPTIARAIFGFAEAYKELARPTARELVRVAIGNPILNSKSLDGTPSNIVQRLKANMLLAKHNERWGRAGCEFLVKVQTLRVYLPNGVPLTRCCTQDPQRLRHGNTAAAIYSAAKRDWLSARELVHTGLCIEHYVFDRCSADAIGRLFRGWHTRRDQCFASSEAHGQHVLDNMMFVLHTYCSLHDLQNALRWLMLTRFNDKTILRDGCIVCEALRFCTISISSNMSQGAIERLDFHPDWSNE